MWRSQVVLGEPVPKRFRPECSREYKEWLKKSLAGTIEPGPNDPHIIADVGAKHQSDSIDFRRSFIRMNCINTVTQKTANS